MPQNEHNEWPSFETVLRDVATSDDIRAREQSVSSASAVATMPEPYARADVPEPPEQAARTVSRTDLNDLLPAPLPPLEIDTSAIRALLHQPGEVSVEPFALEALEPLDTFEPIEALEPLDSFEPIETFDTSEPPSVFDIAFDAPTFDAPAFDGAPAVDFFHEVSGDLVEELPSGAVFELDHDAIEASDEHEEDQGHLTSNPDFTSATIDLFDLQMPDDEFDSVATANAIEGELNELNDLLPDFSIDNPVVDDSDEALFHLDNVVPLRRNLTPEAADKSEPTGPAWMNAVESGEPISTHKTSEVVNDGPPQTRVSHTGWVGLDPVVEPPKPVVVADEPDDPWAHMRPTDAVKQEGFWAKVFGGEERKRAKARRRRGESSDAGTGAGAGPTADSDNVSFDKACPNCGSECQVDLDDPIGRRVHVSCPECDHMWFTPYLESEAG